MVEGRTALSALRIVRDLPSVKGVAMRC